MGFVLVVVFDGIAEKNRSYFHTGLIQLHASSLELIIVWVLYKYV
jgi:hypothetical protein